MNVGAQQFTYKQNYVGSASPDEVEEGRAPKNPGREFETGEYASMPPANNFNGTTPIPMKDSYGQFELGEYASMLPSPAQQSTLSPASYNGPTSNVLSGSAVMESSWGGHGGNATPSYQASQLPDYLSIEKKQSSYGQYGADINYSMLPSLTQTTTQHFYPSQIADVSLLLAETTLSPGPAACVAASDADVSAGSESSSQHTAESDSGASSGAGVLGKQGAKSSPAAAVKQHTISGSGAVVTATAF